MKIIYEIENLKDVSDKVERQLRRMMAEESSMKNDIKKTLRGNGGFFGFIKKKFLDIASASDTLEFISDMTWIRHYEIRKNEVVLDTNPVYYAYLSTLFEAPMITKGVPNLFANAIKRFDKKFKEMFEDVMKNEDEFKDKGAVYVAMLTARKLAKEYFDKDGIKVKSIRLEVDNDAN